MIACHLHIVGKLFDDLNLKSALKTLNVINDPIDFESCKIVFEHALRAGPGYRVRDALKILNVKPTTYGLDLITHWNSIDYMILQEELK